MSSFIMRAFKRCPISPRQSLISILLACHSGLRLIPSQPTSPIQSPQESITQRCYLQVTQSPSHPSICLSFYASPHLYLSLFVPSPALLFHLYHLLFSQHLSTLPICLPSPILSFQRTSQTNQLQGESDFAYRSYPPLTREREEKCLHHLHMKPLSNVMDELHLASANF